MDIANWDRVFLLRGNHETIAQATVSTKGRNVLAKEITEKFGLTPITDLLSSNYVRYRIFRPENEDCKKLSQELGYFFSNLPMALYIGSGNPLSWIQCCHGGIEPTFNPKTFFASQLDYCSIKKNLDAKVAINPEFQKYVDAFYGDSFLPGSDCGFNWCDFGANGTGDKSRCVEFMPGRGYNFFYASLDALLEQIGLQLILRGHNHEGFAVGNEINRKIETNIMQVKDLKKVITFTTTSGVIGAGCDCFGVMKTSQKWDDWVLTAYKHEACPHYYT